MNRVNISFLSELMVPIIGGGDDDELCLYYEELNMHSEEKYRYIIKKYFLENYNSLPEEIKIKSKITLSYLLSKKDYDFERKFNSFLPPFNPPKNAKDFFVWIWEEIFGDESYLIDNLENYQEISNSEEVIEIYEKINKCKIE